MKFLTNLGKVLLAILLLALFLWAASNMSGCRSTVIQTEGAVPKTVAFEGNDQNAGVLVVDAKGAVLTEKKTEEYRALVSLYGRGTDAYKIQPPVRADDGLVRKTGISEGFPGHETVYRLDDEHLSWFITFKKWQRMGRTPAG